MEMEQNNIIPEPTADESSIVNKRKRIPLKFKLFIAFISIPLLILIFLFVIFFIQKSLNTRTKFEKENNIPTEPIVVEQEITTLNAASDKFTLEYPANTELKMPKKDDEVRTYSITYKGPRQPGEIKNEYDLIDGYIVKVMVHKDTINTDIKEIAERKKISYQQICMTGYTQEETLQTTLDTVDAYTFTIQNCPINIKETFALLHNSIYEVVQIYRGDLGYVEKHKQESEKIYNSFVFLDKPDAPELPTVQTYIHNNHQFSFEHPLLDDKCCDVNGPVFGNAEKLVVLADKNSYEQNSGRFFDGFGVFIDLNKENRTFDEYMEIQKATLLDEYKVITGKSSTNFSESEIEVGGVQAVLLKNYAWWGDMIYFQYPSSNKFMIISKVESTPESFNDSFNTILKSFKFNIKKR